MAAISEQIHGLVELRGLRNEAEKTGLPAATYLRANPVRSSPWPGASWGPPTWPRARGCDARAGHCPRSRSAQKRPVVSAADDRGTRHGPSGATVTSDRWLHDPDLGQVVVAEDVLHKRVAELGDELTADYEDRPPLLVGVLKGAFVFMSDLARAIALPVEVDVMAV